MKTKHYFKRLLSLMLLCSAVHAYAPMMARVGNGSGAGSVKDPIGGGIRPPIGPRMIQLDQSPRFMSALKDAPFVYKELSSDNELQLDEFIEKYRVHKILPSRVVLAKEGKVIGLIQFSKTNEEIKFTPSSQFGFVEDNPVIIESVLNEKIRAISEHRYYQ